MLRKTDDEIQRYVKQTTLTKKRRSFEQDMGIDLKAEEDELNTMDKRLNKQKEMEELEKTYYNKAYINDNFEYTHLNDPRTWKPLN